MRTTMGGWAVLAALSLALSGCATASLAPGIAPSEGIVLEAKAFPEVELLTTGGQVHVCKLVRLERDKVSFIPSPYWNVEMRTVTVAEIHSIRVCGLKSHTGRAIGTGFGLVSCLTGVIALGTSEYNTDYRAALLGVPLSGLVIGIPLGFLIGIVEDAGSPPSRYDFSKMSPEQKFGVFRRLMGI